MKRLNILVLILTMIFITATLSAEEVEHSTSIGVDLAYYFPNQSGYGVEGGFLPITYSTVGQDTDSTRSLGSTWGGAEFQAKLNHSITVPFLQGENALVSGNNVKFKFNISAAPVAVYSTISAVLTPIAFLNMELGGTVGTGWSGLGFTGIGNNVDGEIDTSAFPGVVAEFFTSGTFQFDLAAIVPGDWTHIVTQINGQIKYSMFSTEEAIAGEPWCWLADSGDNLNGWTFNGTYFLGYQMPLTINLVGFLVTTTQMIGNNSEASSLAGPDGNILTLDDNGWGSDFVEIDFGPVVNFEFNEHHSLTLLIQLKTGIDYSDDTIFFTYYQDRVAEDTYVKLNRIACSYTYSF